MNILKMKYRYSHHSPQWLLIQSCDMQQKKAQCLFTKFKLVLLVSSSGMGRNTANAMQFAKMVNKMMISKVLEGDAQDHDNNKQQQKSHFAPPKYPQRSIVLCLVSYDVSGWEWEGDLNFHKNKKVSLFIWLSYFTFVIQCKGSSTAGTD